MEENYPCDVLKKVKEYEHNILRCSTMDSFPFLDNDLFNNQKCLLLDKMFLHYENIVNNCDYESIEESYKIIDELISEYYNKYLKH